VVMVNRQDVFGIQLVERILDACLSSLDPIKEQRAEPDGVVGTYRSPSTGRVIQFFMREQQQIASVDGFDLPVESDDKGVLWPSGIFSYAKQSIVLHGDRQRPLSIRFSDFGNLDSLLPVDPGPVDRAKVHRLRGRFRSDITGTDATIMTNGDDLRVQMTGRFGTITYSLDCLAEYVWRAKAVGISWLGGVLSFERDASSFRFSSSSNRTRALTFYRSA